MFISKNEKQDLIYRISVLEQTILSMKTSLIQKPVAKPKTKKTMSPEKRAAQGERMKKMWADKKLKKETA